jgi:hypothetical protein
MTLDPQAQFDEHVLDIIEQSPVGAAPRTPAHQDAMRRLQEAHQIYMSADYADGFATVRTLAALPFFWAENLEGVLTGKVPVAELESDTSIFDRYVASLPEELRQAAEENRGHVVERRQMHRHHKGEEDVHDPLHSLLMMPGVGLNPGMPGNYLFGSLEQLEGTDEDLTGAWKIHLHDRDDGAAFCEMASVEAAFEKTEEVMASAPFQLAELDALGFELN